LAVTTTFRHISISVLIVLPNCWGVPPAGATPESSEWAEFSTMLVRLGSEGRLTGKVGAVIDSGNEATVRSFGSLLERVGLRRATEVAAPASGDLARQATAMGRKVATEAQTSR